MMSTSLLGIAALLGVLLFFEPCTIATHTLYSARVHAEPGAARSVSLGTLWATRSALVVFVLLLAVMLTPVPAWGEYAPAAILAAMATVYIVLRFVYVPVPHLEFWRLLPGAEALPAAVKLGLTLPLFLIVLALAVSFDSAPHAAAAGLLFAGLFTLPTAVVAFTGASRRSRHLLEVSATVTFYLTAALLYAAAVYLLAR